MGLIDLIGLMGKEESAPRERKMRGSTGEILVIRRCPPDEAACYNDVEIESQYEQGADMENDILCACYGVTEAEVQDVLRHHSCNGLKDLTRHTFAGTGCTACHPALRGLMEKRGFTCRIRSSSTVPTGSSEARFPR
jgi:bacterioferritin-associated ferredoxin